MITAVIAIAVASACVAPILVTYPSAYHQMVTVGAARTVFASSASGDHIPRMGFIAKWFDALWYGYDKAFLVAGGLIFFACGAGGLTPTGKTRNIRASSW